MLIPFYPFHCLIKFWFIVGDEGVIHRVSKKLDIFRIIRIIIVYS